MNISCAEDAAPGCACVPAHDEAPVARETCSTSPLLFDTPRSTAAPYAEGESTANATPILQSFFLGGFESASHCRRDGCRVDAARETKHDVLCEQDFALLRSVGVRTVRDALRWHCIEAVEGTYDWSSFTAMLQAAHRTGTQVIWDMCHWGVPSWADPFAPGFVEVFSTFAESAMRVLRAFQETHGILGSPVVCPINEISFWSWVGGDEQCFFPHASGRGHELKRQLVCAANGAIRCMRQVFPDLKILQPEPLIYISPNAERSEQACEAQGHTSAQFEAWDMLLGRSYPELNGDERNVDILGVNYYWNNQWIHHGAHTPPGHAQHRPLHEMLCELWDRYRKPILVSETSAEGEAGPGWLAYVMAEVRQAEQLGVPVLGLCLYPVMDYAGWDDARHCPVGLIALCDNMQRRALRPAMCAELRVQQSIRNMRST